MDMVTLGAALALALPHAEAADAGALLVVGEDGKWVKGEATTATISVSGTTLTITGGE